MNPGDQVGPYQIVKRIGAGGMAEVFEAVRPGIEGFRTRVALKCLHHSDDERFIQLFINEARLGSQLRHVNIVGIQDFNRHGDLYYIAMELVEGVDLETALNSLKSSGRSLEPALAALILLQVLAGLSYAHRAVSEDGKPMGLIHRDIKPANIFLSYEGMAKILDFGVAKALNSAFRTQESVPRGTLAYMSPEQVAGERELTPASDLFGVGAMLYEMLMHQSLYNEPSYPRFLMAVAEADVRDQLKAFKSRFPMLHDILKKALEKDPRKRYQSADEMALALQGALPRLGIAPTIREMLDTLPIKGGGARARSNPGSSQLSLNSMGSPYGASHGSTPGMAKRPVSWALVALVGVSVAVATVGGLALMAHLAKEEVPADATRLPQAPESKGRLTQEAQTLAGAIKPTELSPATPAPSGKALEPVSAPSTPPPQPVKPAKPASAKPGTAADPARPGTVSAGNQNGSSASSTTTSPPAAPVAPTQAKPAPTAPAPSGEGVLIVASVPPDADVYEGGMRMCDVPCELKLSAGTHSLELRSHDGHSRQKFEVKVEPDRVRKMVWDFQQQVWLTR